MTTESSTNPVSWLHGLQDYLDFVKDNESKKHVDFFLSLLYSNNGPISINENLDIQEFMYHLRKFTNNEIVEMFAKYYRLEYPSSMIQDAFSRGQVQSKIWLITELVKITQRYDNILIYAGWMGQLIFFLKHAIEFDTVRIVDLDSVACEISDKIINNDLIEDWKVKSSCESIENIEHFNDHCIIPLTNKAGDTFKTKFEPNLIINTSAEHMDETWFYNIKKDCIVAVQSNNLEDIDEHVNCVTSIDAMKKKFKMSKVLYEGELQLQGYKRFMLIGKK